MQIRQINTAVNQRIQTKSNKNNQPQKIHYVDTVSVNKNQSFKGLGGSSLLTLVKNSLDRFALFIANAIENGGLVVSFTLQDMIGTNLPRPIMGLKRNSKENKGEKNLKFAAKELTREMLTGPSMFAIPAAIIAVGKKAFGKTFDVPMQFIKGFGAIHADKPLEAGKAITKEVFYKNTFAEMLKNANVPEADIPEKAKEFADKLTQALKKQATRKETKAERNKIINNLTNDFIDIAKKNTKNAAHSDYTKAKISDKAIAPFKDVINFMVNYADDLVEKTQSKNSDEITSFIQNLVNKKVIGRFAANMVMFAATTAFLIVIPKLYNKAEGEGNAGLKGLMKEETLNDKSLNSNTFNYMDFAYSKQPKVFNDMITFNTNIQKRNQPSFGSATKVAEVAKSLTGNKFLGKFAQAAEFEGMNVSFPFLLGFMGLGVLTPRLIQAKDKYDREEILRRDVVTCTTMAFAEKALRKGFSKFSEATSGLVVTAKGENFDKKGMASKLFDYIRPIKGVQVLNSEQIISKYSGIDKLKNGIDDFCDFIIGGNGNLSKVFSLTDDAKSIVQNILQKEGKNIADADNETIKKALSNAKESEELKKLVDMFKDKNNPWVKKAKTLNARFTAFSVCLLVPVFLGFMLPAINERATKKRIKTESEQAKLNISK